MTNHHHETNEHAEINASVLDLEHKPSWRSYVVFTLAGLFLLFEFILQVSPAVMTHQLMANFDVGASTIGFISGAYYYSYTFMQIPGGLFYDRFSAKKIISFALIFCVIGTLLFAFSHQVWMAALGRFLMGGGSAFAFVGTLVMAARWFPSNRFAFFVGMAQVLTVIGAMSGVSPVAFAVKHLGWRNTLMDLAIIGVALAVLCYSLMQDKSSFAAAKASARQTGILKSLGIIARNKQSWFIGLYAFMGWAPVTAFASLWGVPFLMRDYHLSLTVAGAGIMLIWLGQGIASPILGWWSDKLGKRNLPMNLAALVGFVASILVIYLPMPLVVLFILLFIFGLATGGQILTFAVAKEINKPNMVGAAVGFTNMTLVASGAAMQPLIGYLLHLNWQGEIRAGVHYYSATDFKMALFLVPLSFFIAFLASQFLIRETRCQAKY